MKGARFYAIPSFDSGLCTYYDLMIVVGWLRWAGPGWFHCVKRPTETCGKGEPSWQWCSSLELNETGGMGGRYLHVSEAKAKEIDPALIKWYRKNPREKS